MEHILNEEKARELAFESPQCQMYIYNKCNQNFTCDRFKIAFEMAQWKDNQFAEEKQQLIDKAAEWFSYRFPNISREAFEKFKDDMKGE